MKIRLLLALAGFAAVTQFCLAQQSVATPVTPKAEPKSTSDRLLANPTVAGLVGTIVGIVISSSFALLKSKIDGAIQENLEKTKAKFSKDNAVSAELRMHVASVARELFSVQHSMEWLCFPTDDNSQLTKEDKLLYNNELHTSFS